MALVDAVPDPRAQRSFCPSQAGSFCDQDTASTGDAPPPPHVCTCEPVEATSSSAAAAAWLARPAGGVPAAARASSSRPSHRPARKSRGRCRRASRPTVPGSGARWSNRRGVSRKKLPGSRLLHGGAAGVCLSQSPQRKDEHLQRSRQGEPAGRQGRLLGPVLLAPCLWGQDAVAGRAPPPLARSRVARLARLARPRHLAIRALLQCSLSVGEPSEKSL